ncbi:P-loop containing nucleoside triphosphate hydrolase protein [Parathielavia hyrcaniae]|uniref:P-loop containing nucleoside triphosphate hydrolase protein n=1 Tax=Parathielavia hyrcaniae TaxID=113614 RepID=A0AAN6PRV6_9PEZI|nr:P-loop containing nucleoside triphosphate hydrolase protein [Parathielavia hyrcaniae]
MAKIPCHPPSEFPPGLLRLSAPAENMAEETNLPAGHTIWLTAPTPRPIPDKIVRHKLVVAGPPKSGKTKSLMAFAHGTWFDDHPYRAAVFEPYITDTEVDGTHVELVLTEAPANEDYLRLRPLSYQDASVVVLAFAIDRPESLEDACAFWVSEATHYCPDVPTVLVGLKEDLRRDPLTIRELAKRDQNPVSYQQGLAAARYVGAAAYVEFSAKTGEGVQTAFEAAEKLALYWPGEPRKQALGGKNPLKGACSVM